MDLQKETVIRMERQKSETEASTEAHTGLLKCSAGCVRCCVCACVRACERESERKMYEPIASHGEVTTPHPRLLLLYQSRHHLSQPEENDSEK